MRELVVARECELKGDSEALDGADGDASDCAADAEINERVLAAVFGSNPVDHHYCKDSDK